MKGKRMGTRNKTDKGGKPLTRADVERLLREAGSPDKLNLSRRNLQGTDLSNFNLRGANLSGANLRGANLKGADLSEANLSKANLSDIDLTTVNLLGANLKETNLGNFIYVGGHGGSGKTALMSQFIGRVFNTREHAAINDMLDDMLTIHIRIIEEPLTAQNLNSIISSLTELSTKYWLIAKGRFADLIEYTQTHNGSFAEEANIIITRVSYNSPFNMDWKVDLSASSVAEAPSYYH